MLTDPHTILSLVLMGAFCIILLIIFGLLLAFFLDICWFCVGSNLRRMFEFDLDNDNDDWTWP